MQFPILFSSRFFPWPASRIATTAFAFLVALGIFSAGTYAQDAQTESGTSGRVSQIGRRNRIVFDGPNEPSPQLTATPVVKSTPAPRPSTSPEGTPAFLNPEGLMGMSPSPSPTPAEKPQPTPSAAALEAYRTPPPVPVATPTPTPIIAPAPVVALASPTPTATPLQAAPRAPQVAAATPSPAPTATPNPVVVEATPTPKIEMLPQATPALPLAAAAPSVPPESVVSKPSASPAPVAVSKPTPSPMSAAVPPAVRAPVLAVASPSPKTEAVAAATSLSSAVVVASPAAVATVPDTASATSAPLTNQAATPLPQNPAASTKPAGPSAADDRGTSVNVVADASKPDLAPQVAVSSPPPSQSVTINLINKLVERGILTKEDAAGMIKQAEAEADVARQQAQTDMMAMAQAAATQVVTDQAVLAQNGPPTNSDNDVRVTYIPEPVKTQIKEDIKMELVSEAKKGSFRVGPSPFMPEWVARVHPYFDLRLRYEGDFFPAGNDATGAFPNFNAINTGPPFDVSGNQFAPQYNVDQNRNRFRIRARFGAEFELTKNITMGGRIGTGESNTPVTMNQTIGLANQGQGGNFSKYAIWLDRAFLRYEIGNEPDRNLSLIVGRFDNPFFSTNLIWWDDLGFDGMALQAKYEVFDGVAPFFNGGVFPVFNTDFNYSSNQPSKFQSEDKYLFGGQLGLDVKAIKDWEFKVATAYYYFYNIEGKLSSPFTPQNASDAGNTDDSRPSFAQKGNTYFPIRNIVPDASNDYGAINQYQYYGLATKFQELALTGRIDYNGFEPVQISLIGEAVQNLAFNKNAINSIAVNNRGPVDTTLANSIGQFEGSGLGWIVNLRVGTPLLEKAWDWGITLGYRWIGSDSVVDGFNDSDFGTGGTNMKGFTVGGQLALSPNVWVGLRWMGADSIAGPTNKIDIIQFDLNSKF